MHRKLLRVKTIGMLVASLVFFMAVGHAEEERTDASGQWRYVLEDGGASITGYVTEPDARGYSKEPSGELVIPGELDGYSVTGIGEMVFWRCIGLTSVVIPDGVTSIGLWAFDECENLTSVVIPDSVTSIGNWALIEWYDKLTLRVQEGSYAEQYAVENGIPYVLAGSKASMVADDEELVDAEEVVEDDEEERTDASGRWTYVLENGGATIWRCEMEPSGQLVIPSELDGYPVTAISDEALWGHSGLTGVAIPDSVTSIGIFAFVECDGLLHIDVSSSNPAYGQIDGVLFDKSLKTLISYPAAREGAYTVPEGVTHIEGTAFNGCKSLTGVTVPASVSFIGEDPFYGCEEVTLTVREGSYAEQYARENSIPYVLAAAAKADDDVFALIGGSTFTFSSGAGGWSTELIVSEDGSFTGHFHDWDMGDTGDDYPEGTRYECFFTGVFTVAEKIDPFTYELRLTALNLEEDAGVERIEDGVRVISAGPYGIENGDVFMLYCPGRATADLPESFLDWISMPNAWEEIPNALPFYGLYNTAEKFGFFSHAER